MDNTIANILAPLFGVTICRVPYGQWIIQIDFDNDYELGIEYHWEYRNAAGILLDRWIEKVGERTSFLLWRLVGKTVSNAHYEVKISCVIGVNFRYDHSFQTPPQAPPLSCLHGLDAV